ncbi:MAG: hypothetical protein H0W61_14175 [Bacteroidetes bacterium]|nr:hypothetical protein [Bacteroidota bacterium]
MKVIYKYISIAVVLFFLTACHKYPEGGFVFQRIKHLFGDNKDMAHKGWKLKLYEVNGIDSTEMIKGRNLSSDGEGNFIVFSIAWAHSRTYFAGTYVYHYTMSIDKKAKLFSIGSELNANDNDTSQCFIRNNILTCQRNIFNPERNRATEWSIRKLTKTKLIITKSLVNTYKIVLTH